MRRRPACYIGILPNGDFLSLRYHSHHWQRKTQSQLVLQINLNVMQPELLKLHPAKVMDVGGVPFHLLSLELHLRLRQHLLLIYSDDA